MSLEKKAAYRFRFLKSEEWSTIRSAVLASEKGLCFICGVEDSSNDVHHMFYRKSWIDTKVEDCHVLCRRCHKLIHDSMVSDELKGMTAMELKRVFAYLADGIRKKLTDGKFTPSSNLPHIKIRKPADYLREALAQARAEIESLKSAPLGVDMKDANSKPSDPDFIGPIKRKRPSDFLREKLYKTQDELKVAKQECEALRSELDSLKIHLAHTWSNWSV